MAREEEAAVTGMALSVATGAGLSAKGLSLTAELLLLAIDPSRGGLFPRHRGRFRKALALAHHTDRGFPDRGLPRKAIVKGRRARREAVRELHDVALVKPKRALRRLRLAPASHAETRFHQLVDRVREDQLTDPRDQELLLLLAASGVLAHRLSDEERHLAATRLRTLGRRATDRDALVSPERRARRSPLIVSIATGYAGRTLDPNGFGLGYSAPGGGGGGGGGGDLTGGYYGDGGGGAGGSW